MPYELEVVLKPIFSYIAHGHPKLDFAWSFVSLKECTGWKVLFSIYRDSLLSESYCSAFTFVELILMFTFSSMGLLLRALLWVWVVLGLSGLSKKRSKMTKLLF